MTAHAITCLWLLTAQARQWLHRHCTPAGRQAMQRRQRERELRRAGVSRNVATLAASRMVLGVSKTAESSKLVQHRPEVAIDASKTGFSDSPEVLRKLCKTQGQSA